MVRRSVSVTMLVTMLPGAVVVTDSVKMEAEVTVSVMSLVTVAPAVERVTVATASVVPG